MSVLALSVVAHILLSQVEQPDVAPQPADEQRDSTRTEKISPIVEPAWRLSIAAGQNQPTSSDRQWYTQSNARVVATFERSLVLPGLFILGAASIWHTDIKTTSLGVTLSEGMLGATYEWPASGVGGWLFPYAKMGILVDHYRFSTALQVANNVAPGLLAAVGLRAGLPRMGPTKRVRFFGFFEPAYALRTTIRPTLEAKEEKNTKATPIRLGSTNLSGFVWSLGGGIAF